MDSMKKQPWPHDHIFDGGNVAGERGTRLVVVITALMMAVEIFAGWWFNSTRIVDLHVWRVGKQQFACIVAVASDSTVTAEAIRGCLGQHEELTHITIEIHHGTKPFGG